MPGMLFAPIISGIAEGAGLASLAGGAAAAAAVPTGIAAAIPGVFGALETGIAGAEAAAGLGAEGLFGLGAGPAIEGVGVGIPGGAMPGIDTASSFFSPMNYSSITQLPVPVATELPLPVEAGGLDTSAMRGFMFNPEAPINPQQFGLDSIAVEPPPPATDLVSADKGLSNLRFDDRFTGLPDPDTSLYGEGSNFKDYFPDYEPLEYEPISGLTYPRPEEFVPTPQFAPPPPPQSFPQGLSKLSFDNRFTGPPREFSDVSRSVPTVSVSAPQPASPLEPKGDPFDTRFPKTSSVPVSAYAPAPAPAPAPEPYIDVGPNTGRDPYRGWYEPPNSLNTYNPLGRTPPIAEGVFPNPPGAPSFSARFEGTPPTSVSSQVNVPLPRPAPGPPQVNVPPTKSVPVPSLDVPLPRPAPGDPINTNAAGITSREPSTAANRAIEGLTKSETKILKASPGIFGGIGEGMPRQLAQHMLQQEIRRVQQEETKKRRGMARGGLTSIPSRYIKGPGSGRDDSVKAVIDGKRPARLSSGEYVIDAEAVAMLGDGSSEEGARRLDEFRESIRKHKGANLSRGEISPNAKSPSGYMAGGRPAERYFDGDFVMPDLYEYDASMSPGSSSMFDTVDFNTFDPNMSSMGWSAFTGGDPADLYGTGTMGIAGGMGKLGPSPEEIAAAELDAGFKPRRALNQPPLAQYASLNSPPNAQTNGTPFRGNEREDQYGPVLPGIDSVLPGAVGGAPAGGGSKSFIDKIGNYIQEKPLQSAVLGTMGLGMLSSLLSRRGGVPVAGPQTLADLSRGPRTLNARTPGRTPAGNAGGDYPRFTSQWLKDPIRAANGGYMAGYADGGGIMGIGGPSAGYSGQPAPAMPTGAYTPPGPSYAPPMPSMGYQGMPQQPVSPMIAPNISGPQLGELWNAPVKPMSANSPRLQDYVENAIGGILSGRFRA